jgi:hypothetical protein
MQKLNLSREVTKKLKFKVLSKTRLKRFKKRRRLAEKD